MKYIPVRVSEQIVINEFYSLFKVKYENGFSFSGESHNFWECMYVIEGGVCVSADERIYKLKRGEIVFHKPLELHKFYVDNPDGATLLIFSFTMTGEISKFFENKVFALSAEQTEIISLLLDYINLRIKSIRTPDRKMQHEEYLIPFKYIKNYSQMIQTYVYQLFLLISESNTEARVSSEYNASIFKDAVEYMNLNLCLTPSVLDIAKNCGVSESGLKRIFEKYAGIGVHKYFLKLKVKAAVKMLSSGISVTQTAKELGFSSQGYFSKVFKREMGVLPSQIK